MPGPDQDLLDVLDVVQGTGSWRAASQLLGGHARGERDAAGSGSRPSRARPRWSWPQRPGAGGRWLRTWRAEAPKDAGGGSRARGVPRAAGVAHSAAVGPTTSGSSWRRPVRSAARRPCWRPATPCRTSWSWPSRGDSATPTSSSTSCGRRSSTAPRRTWAPTSPRCTTGARSGTAPARRPTAFATAAAARAPQGSLLAALPLFAVYEHLPEVNLVQGFYRERGRHEGGRGRDVRGALGARGRPDARPRTAPAGPLPGPHGTLGGGDAPAGARRRPRGRRCPGPTNPTRPAEYTVYRALAVAGYEANGGSPATLPH